MASLVHLSPNETLETFRDLAEGLDEAGLLIHTMGRTALASYFMALWEAAPLYEDSDRRQQLIAALSQLNDVEVERKLTDQPASLRVIVLGDTAVTGNYLGVGLRYDDHDENGNAGFYPKRLLVGISYAGPGSLYTASKSWTPPFLLPHIDRAHLIDGRATQRASDDDLRVALGVVRHFNNILSTAMSEIQPDYP